MQWPFVYVDQPWRLDQLQKMVSRCHHGGRHLKREKQSILELLVGRRITIPHQQTYLLALP